MVYVDNRTSCLHWRRRPCDTDVTAIILPLPRPQSRRIDDMTSWRRWRGRVADHPRSSALYRSHIHLQWDHRVPGVQPYVRRAAVSAFIVAAVELHRSTVSRTATYGARDPMPPSVVTPHRSVPFVHSSPTRWVGGGVVFPGPEFSGGARIFPKMLKLLNI